MDWARLSRRPEVTKILVKALVDRFNERQAEIKDQEYWKELKVIIRLNEEVIFTFFSLTLVLWIWNIHTLCGNHICIILIVHDEICLLQFSTQSKCEMRCSRRPISSWSHSWPRKDPRNKSVFIAFLEWKIESILVSSNILITVVVQTFGRWWQAWLH